MNPQGKFETRAGSRVMQPCNGNRRRGELACGSSRETHFPPRDEQAVSAAHFSIVELARLHAASVDAALTVLELGPEAVAKMANTVVSLERRALFSCMLERCLAVPLTLLGARSLLIIDDEPAVLRSMVRVLRQAAPDLKLVLAESGVDGLAQARTLRPDAILVDAYMPEVRGVEVCARIRADGETEHIPVLAMSADPTPELARAFEQAGAVAFLEKPLEISALFEILSTQLLPNTAGDW
jgi:CheY-like chemotaxis protein